MWKTFSMSFFAIFALENDVNRGENVRETVDASENVSRETFLLSFDAEA